MFSFPKTPEEKLKMKDNIIRILFANLLVSIVAGAMLIIEGVMGKHNFDNIVNILITFIAMVSFLIIIIKAGFTVIKSLFFIAAEISLLIYLSQSYCTVSNRNVMSDDALKNILIIGLLYIVISFFRSLWKGLREEYRLMGGDNCWEKKVFIALFIAFIIFFIWQIYLVIWPIVQSLCVAM